jgi:D-glycero-D-manno-heptose 1,7-bisphosphate phosphatase
VHRAVFLDRDGVINRKAPDGEYIANGRELVLLPRVLSAVRVLHDAGFLLFVATNQRGIARQKVNPDELENIHNRLLHLFSAAGAPITKIYVCPHEGDCDCRKPAPGMLLRAAKEYGIDLGASWCVGDSASDVEAGKRAGCRTTLIQTNQAQQMPGVSADFVAPDLAEAAQLMLRADRAYQFWTLPYWRNHKP